MLYKLAQKSQRLLIVFFSLIISWFLIVKLTQLPSFILPGPITVFRTAYQHAYLLIYHASYTLIETLLGLIIATISGILSAIIIFSYTKLRRLLQPLLIISQSLPTFVIAPLFVLWFGYGMQSKVAITILMLYFPITSTFYDGLMQCPQIWLDNAIIVTRSQWRILWLIQLRAALPKGASGLRIAAAIAPIGAIIGEWIGSNHGLGYLMLMANARLQTSLLFASLLVTVILSLLLYFTIDRLLTYFISWQTP